MTAVEMHDDDGFRKHLLHSIVACTDEARILLRILLDVTHRPKQSVGGLVAHLHPARLNVVFLQQREHFDGVLCEVALHLLVAVSLPGFGNRLLTRVGPRVAIVEVNHELHAQCFHATRHREEFVFVARPAPRVHPHTHADGRHLVVVLQQFQTFTLASVAVVEFHSVPLLPSEESHIGTFHEIGCCCLLCAGDKRQHQ